MIYLFYSSLDQTDAQAMSIQPNLIQLLAQPSQIRSD